MYAEEFYAPSQWSGTTSGSNITRNDLIRTLNHGLTVFPEVMSFCDESSSNRVPTQNRIGGESLEAEVYQVESPSGIKAALKIMPVIKESDSAKNANEIKYAGLFSDIVQRGLSPHFLLVYGHGHCPRVHYYQGGRFSEFVGPADFLLSELAFCELRVWMAKPHPINEWILVLTGIISGLQVLVSNGVSHQDLHPGNILIYSEDYPIPLIHDFGHAGPLTTYTEDITKIFSYLFNIYSPMPEYMQPTIPTMLVEVLVRAQIEGFPLIQTARNFDTVCNWIKEELEKYGERNSREENSREGNSREGNDN